jgi:hypothetical protein
MPRYLDRFRRYRRSDGHSHGRYKYRITDSVCNYRFFSGWDLPEGKVVHVTAMPAMVRPERE